MEEPRKSKKSYITTQRIWDKVKLFKIQSKIKDTDLALDELINLGYSYYSLRQKD